MPLCSRKRRSAKQETFKRLSVNFITLKQRNKKGRYHGDDDACKEAAKEIIQSLRELTETESDTVLKFKVLSIKDHQKLNDQIEGLEMKLRNEKRQYESRIHKEIQSLETELKRLNGAKNEVENENKSIKKTAELQNEDNTKEIHRLKFQIEDAKKHLDEEKEGLQKAAKLQQEIDAEKIGKLESEIKKLENLNTRNEEKLETISKKPEEKENNERLGAAAAHRLLDQNPGITDLSDPNRPLAEKVSELYDNEWTNAMENLEKLDIQEDKGIRILLKIIKNVFDTCVDFGDTHLESFPDLLALPPVIYQLQKERVLSVKDMSSEMLKPMKDFRKSNAEHALSRLQMYIAAEIKSKLHIKQKVYDSCKEYIEKCVELCWMMRIQDPPIYMEADYKTNSTFDSNIMRSYKKAGKLVHFVVWPTFFLHKDGPLLAQGVVQGSKLKIAVEESSSSSADDTDDDDKFFDAQTDISDDKKSRTDDVSDAKQSDSGSGKLPNDNNITTIDTECLENKGKGKDDRSPAGNQSDQGNGEQTTDKNNTTIETNCSETDDKGESEDFSQITESDPEKNKLPNDNSNTPNGSNCSDNGDNEAADVVAGLGNDMSQNTLIGTKHSENDGEGGDNDEEAAGRGEKVADTHLPTDEREID